LFSLHRANVTLIRHRDTALAAVAIHSNIENLYRNRLIASPSRWRHPVRSAARSDALQTRDRSKCRRPLRSRIRRKRRSGMTVEELLNRIWY
ncbi:MAG: hypothetical protein WBQ49_07910, partial [Rhodomicrobium sp.]